MEQGLGCSCLCWGEDTAAKTSKLTGIQKAAGKEELNQAKLMRPHPDQPCLIHIHIVILCHCPEIISLHFPERFEHMEDKDQPLAWLLVFSWCSVAFQ